MSEAGTVYNVSRDERVGCLANLCLELCPINVCGVNGCLGDICGINI